MEQGAGPAKEKIRRQLRSAGGGLGSAPDEAGRLAQALRRMPGYRRAGHLFCTPEPCLVQVRINALVDGKTLVMPAPGLREGFFLCKPYTIPFPDLAYAVTYRGLARFGRRLSFAAMPGLAVDLLVCGAVAVDRQGGRLGRGQGFFDLACALLAATGGLAARPLVVAAGSAGQLVDHVLPRDPWDVPVNFFLTSAGVKILEPPGQARPEIYWSALPARRIRKIDPLWKLYCVAKDGKKPRG